MFISEVTMSTGIATLVTADGNVTVHRPWAKQAQGRDRTPRATTPGTTPTATSNTWT